MGFRFAWQPTPSRRPSQPLVGVAHRKTSRQERRNRRPTVRWSRACVAHPRHTLPLRAIPTTGKSWPTLCGTSRKQACVHAGPSWVDTFRGFTRSWITPSWVDTFRWSTRPWGQHLRGSAPPWVHTAVRFMPPWVKALRRALGSAGRAAPGQLHAPPGLVCHRCHTPVGVGGVLVLRPCTNISRRPSWLTPTSTSA